MTMALDDIPLMSMLKSRFGYLSQQQRGIAVNVANSDTPGFVPKDLTAFHYSVPGKAIALKTASSVELADGFSATVIPGKGSITVDSDLKGLKR